MQFSLEELLRLEDERISEQQRARSAQAAAAAREREIGEERRRAEEEARRRAELDEQEKRRRAELDEIARREAMQKAIVEQARLEVDVRARAAERDLERRHEIELERLRAEGRKGQLGRLAGAALLGGAVMLAVLLTIHLGVAKPAADRRLGELAGSLLAAEARANAAAQQVEEQRKVIGALDHKLRATAAELEGLQARSTPRPSSPSSGPGGGQPPVRPPPGRPALPPTPPCLRGDPLCPTL